MASAQSKMTPLLVNVSPISSSTWPPPKARILSQRRKTSQTTSVSQDSSKQGDDGTLELVALFHADEGPDGSDQQAKLETVTVCDHEGTARDGWNLGAHGDAVGGHGERGRAADRADRRGLKGPEAAYVVWGPAKAEGE